MARNAIFIFGLGALLVLSPTAAFAAGGDDSDFNRPGFYLGLGGIYAVDFFADDVSDITDGLISVEDGSGVNAKAGYRVNSWFAAELFYEFAHNMNGNVTIDIPPLVTVPLFDVKTHTFTANAKFIGPWWRAQPYIVLGLGFQRSILEDLTNTFGSEKDFNVSGRVGGGIDYHITRNVTVGVEVAGVLSASDYGAPGGDLNDLFYLSAGGNLTYRF